MRLRPITLKAAKQWVAQYHRHNAPPVGWKFGTSLWDEGGECVGVAMAGRPVARELDKPYFIEITRVCTLGAKNACSKLYSAVCRAAQALGYTRAITYTLVSEPGSSLLAAGFKPVATVKGRGWDTPSRRRTNPKPTEDKIRWEREL